MLRLVALGLVWLAVTGATPLPLKPPTPDLAGLVPWASAPLDKPPVQVPRLAPPPPPVDLPPVAPARVVAPPGPKPSAPVPSPRALPCVGAWLRIASESLECGRARFGKGEDEEAARALEQAVRTGTEADVLREARYWYGEVLYRLGRFEQADWLFRQVVKDGARSELGSWALHSSGWTALRLGDAARAHGAFVALLRAPTPAPLDVWGRHGLALVLHALGRHEEAEKTWAELSARRLPAPLGRDIAFWHGEALGRIGQHERAVEKLAAFTRGGAHPLLGVAYVRLGWWSLAAGRPRDGAAAFRAFLARPPGGARDAPQERDWAEAGLAVALITSNDWAGARNALNALDARRSALGLPIRLRLAQRAVDSGQAAEAHVVLQEVLAANLTPPVRAWVLLVKGEAHRAEGNRDEARTQYELARLANPESGTGRYATLRLAQTNFELREFAQAASDLGPLLAGAATPDLRAAALLLQGEAAYHAGNYPAAAAAYRRMLVEFPNHPQAAAARLALPWAVLRQGQKDTAREQFLEFARTHPSDAHTLNALLLASELTLAVGNLDAARELLERIIAAYPSQSRTDFARLNRALLMLRTGQTAVAQRELRDWITRGSFPPLAGRAHGALGAALLAAGRPADAAKEFARADAEGFSDFARLGLGAAALVDERLDDATKAFTEARDTGTPAIAAAAEYGLAAVGLHRGNPRDFKPAARAALTAAPRGLAAPRLLYVLVGLAAEDKDWPEALALAKRLTADFPQDEAADDAFERIGAAAAKASAWPVAYEAWAFLRQQYPQSPFAEGARVTFAQTQLETGRIDEAKRALEEFVAAAPGDPRAGQAWMALGRAREVTGDRAGALEAFARATRSGGSSAFNREAMLAHARLLAAERRWDEARGVLERLLRSAEGANAVETALALGETWDAQGDHLSAAEYFMTAAYLAPESPAGRRALLAAGRSFAAAKDSEAAAIVYRKLLAQSDVPGEVADAARRGLAELRR
jgi:tetratricopeptide (TPR) repeat protein